MTDRPSMFVGSSREGLHVAEAIQQNLDNVCEVIPWSQGVFGLGEAYLYSLLDAVEKYDFAVLVLTADDQTTARGSAEHSPRDNVIFELGLFLGGMGRARTFIVHDRSVPLKIPSDLAGIAKTSYVPPEKGTWKSALGSATAEISGRVRELGPRAKGRP